MTVQGATAVLIIEDNADESYILSQFLEQATERKYTVKTATSIKKAQHHLSKYTPDLILLDLNLPDSQELATLYFFRKNYPDITVIVITGISDDDVEYKAMQHGAQEYLIKGDYSKNEFLRAVKHALDRKQRVIDVEVERKVLEKAQQSDEKQVEKLGQIQEQRYVVENHALLDKLSELEKIAHYDPLTKLPNRLQFDKALSSATAIMRRKKDRFAVCFIDLDHFKMVNDTYGHDVGDALLQAVTQRMVSCLRREDVLARFGGDEFGLLLWGGNYGVAEKVARKIVNKCQKVFNIGGHSIGVSVSIGIALYPEAGVRTSDLLKHADVALYGTKKAGRNSYQFFQQQVEQDHTRQKLIERLMRFAIQKKELSLKYQPIVSLQTGKVIGIETLLRWYSDTLGEVSPSEFIPIIETTSTIFDVTRWVLENSCHQFQQWLQQDWCKHVFLSIHVSLMDVTQTPLSELIIDMLERYKIPTACFKVELSEMAIMQSDGAAEDEIRRLEQFGIDVLMGKFGVGYSSLSKLPTLPISMLKVDRSFVKNLLLSESDAQVVKSVLTLANALSLDVVAGGIETKEVLSYLIDLGCKYGQGHQIVRPLSSVDIEDYMHGKKFLVSDEEKVSELVNEYVEFRKVGHDIANVLAAVVGYANLMLSGDNKAWHQHLRSITSSTDNVMQLIKSLSVLIRKAQLERSISGVSKRKSDLQNYADQLQQAIEKFAETTQLKLAILKDAVKTEKEEPPFLAQIEKLLSSVDEHKQALNFLQDD